MGGKLLATVPGGEAKALDGLHGELASGSSDSGRGSDSRPSPGAYSAAITPGRGNGRQAGLGFPAAWQVTAGRWKPVRRRTFCPAGRPLADPSARREKSRLGLARRRLAGRGPGRDTSAILSAAADGNAAGTTRRRRGKLGRSSGPRTRTRRSRGCAHFVVSLELRHSDITDRADGRLPRRSSHGEGGNVRETGKAANVLSSPRLPPNAHRRTSAVLAALADESRSRSRPP